MTIENLICYRKWVVGVDAEQRLAVIEEGMSGLKRDMSEVRGNVSDLIKNVSSIDTKVDLLVAGKINTPSSTPQHPVQTPSPQGQAQSTESMAKVTAIAIDLAKLALAALFGFMGGKGS